MLQMLRQSIADLPPAYVAHIRRQVFHVVWTCGLLTLEIFFIGGWYCCAVNALVIREVVDLMPALEVLWIAGMQISHLEILYFLWAICSRDFVTRVTVFKLTAKEVWAVCAAIVGQMYIGWNLATRENRFFVRVPSPTKA